MIVPVPTGSGFGTTARCEWPVASSTTPAMTSTPTAVTKRYVGSAKVSPDSRTPRRLTSTISSRQPSERATLCPASDGASEVTAKIPAEIETATVRT